MSEYFGKVEFNVVVFVWTCFVILNFSSMKQLVRNIIGKSMNKNGALSCEKVYIEVGRSIGLFRELYLKNDPKNEDPTIRSAVNITSANNLARKTICCIVSSGRSKNSVETKGYFIWKLLYTIANYLL